MEINMRLKDFVERLENANATLDEIAEEIDGSQSATAAVRAIYVLGVVAGAYTQNYFLTWGHEKISVHAASRIDLIVTVLVSHAYLFQFHRRWHGSSWYR